MKKISLQNRLAGYTGNILLYGYSVYMFVKGTESFRESLTEPEKKGHIHFTGSQFKIPCYN